MEIEVLRDNLNTLVDEVQNNTTTATNAYNESLRFISNYIIESVGDDKKDIANTAVSKFLNIIIEYSDYISKKFLKSEL